MKLKGERAARPVGVGGGGSVPGREKRTLVWKRLKLSRPGRAKGSPEGGKSIWDHPEVATLPP